MNTLVYCGPPGKRAWQAVPRPVLQAPTDALARIITSTICGTDLHTLKGDLATITAGRILRHEGIGIATDAFPRLHAVPVPRPTDGQ